MAEVRVAAATAVARVAEVRVAAVTLVWGVASGGHSDVWCSVRPLV